MLPNRRARRHVPRGHQPAPTRPVAWAARPWALVAWSLGCAALSWTGSAAASPTCGDGALPDHVHEVSRTLQEPWATVRLDIDLPAGRWLDPATLDQLSWRYIRDLQRWGVRHVRLEARLPRTIPGVGQRGDWVRADALLPPNLAPKPRPWEAQLGPEHAAPRRRGRAPRRAPSPALGGSPWVGAVDGALSGKVVYLSPGHGFYWSSKLGRWATQRPNTHNIVEDLVNAEGALHYLVPMLRNAGATVVGVRELDRQADMAVADDADSAAYKETGTWQAGAGQGFGGLPPYKNATNPFALGSYRAAKVTGGAPDAVATWTLQVPSPGTYTVYVGYTAGGNRAADAHFEVTHAGGTRSVRVNQRRHGQTWHALGQFTFTEHAVVRLFNDTAGPTDRVVIADVVRIGGGRGDIVRGNGQPPAKGPTSGKPRWEECSRYYAQYAGAPEGVWNSSSDDDKDDVTARSRFAAWHHEQGEDAVFVSWHSNAASGPARGTSTYVYGPNPPNNSKNYQGTVGSTELGAQLQKHLVADIRSAFDPTWKDRGLYSAYFGEVNPKANPEMPAALIECAFHSTKEDADFLREPRFRHVLARAITKAIIHFFAARDAVSVKLPPEPPTSLALGASGLLTWLPGPSGGHFGHGATQFVVQTSTDGRAFSEGTVVDDTSHQLQMPASNQPVFARVRALNAGGVSAPSAVVGASAGCDVGADVLWVDGFTRLQASQLPVDDLSPWSLGKVQRLRQEQVNRFDYAAEHVADLAAAGRAVASVQRAAFVSQGVPPTARLVVWAAGEQSTHDGVMSAAERKVLSDWLQLGGDRAVILNGSEVTWALDKKGDKASADWLTTWFGARYGDDDAGVYSLAPASGSPLSWSGGDFDDGSHGTYDVDWPDVLELHGATALLDYSGGKGVAGSLFQVGDARSVLLGVPLETVVPPAKREALVASLLAALKTPAPFVSGCGVAPGEGDPATADAGSADAGSSPDGHGSDGRSSDGPADGGADGAAGSGDAGTAPTASPRDPGCGCAVAGPRAAGPTGGAAVLLLGLLGTLLRRRRVGRARGADAG